MPQNPVDDWQEVQDDWQEIKPASQNTASRWPSTPPPAYEQPDPYKSFFDSISPYIPQGVKDFASWATTPPEWIKKPLTDAAMSASQYINPERRADYSLPSLSSAYLESLANTTADMATPLNAATMGAFAAEGAAAKAGMPMVAKGMLNTGKALSAPMMATGAYHTATAENVPEALMGAVELAGGYMGVKSKPSVAKLKKRNGVTETPKVETQLDLPLHEEMPSELPLNKPAPIVPDEGVTPPPETIDPQAQALRDQTEPIVQQPNKELYFVDPKTGEVKTAAEAKPGDVPITGMAEPEAPVRRGKGSWHPDLGGGMPSELPLPEPKSQGPKSKFNSITDWLNDLAKDETGEFNPDALFGRNRQPEQERLNWDGMIEETPQTEAEHAGQTTETARVPEWNRRDMDSMDNVRLRDYVNGYRNRNTPEGRAIVQYGESLLNDRIATQQTGPSNITNRYDLEGGWEQLHDWNSADLDEFIAENANSSNRQLRDATSYANGILSSRAGRYSHGTPLHESLTEAGRSNYEKTGGELKVKSGDTGALKKIFGEERLGEVKSGNRLEFDPEVPKGYRRAKTGKLAKGTLQTWNNWGDSTVADVPHDAGKPGISFEQDSTSFFPDSFKIYYRDPEGVPLGVLKTDLEGTGISTLAVRSDIGLRRGKVAFELLKQAFDKGVSEPSGMTSELTQNLIERVKKALKSESGEVDFDALYRNIASLLNKVGNSKIGQSIKNFLKDESGAVDMDRLNELFEKKKTGTLTDEELTEARAMARELKYGQSPREHVEGKSQVDTGPIVPENAGVKSGRDVVESLAKRMQRANEAPPSGNLHAAEDIAGLLDDAERLSREQKPNLIREILGANKALLTSWDLSAPGRQGKAFLLNKSWRDAWMPMFRAWKSDAAAKLVQQSIIDHPSGYFKPTIKVVDRFGRPRMVSYAEQMGLDLASTEEQFRTTFGKNFEKYTGVDRASRAHTAFLNKLRSDQFVAMMEAAEKAGLDPSKVNVRAKKYATFINDATGRSAVNGKLKLGKAVLDMNDVFFAPRNMVGQAKTWGHVLNPRNYSSTDPVMRKQALKSLFAIAGLGLSTSALAKMGGADVTFDPRSTDFAKIKIGDDRVDPFGGYQQLPVAAAKFISGQSEPTTGKNAGRVMNLDAGKYGQETRGSVAERFFTNRLSPLASFVWAWSFNREFDGKPFEYKRALFERTFPIVAKDLIDLAQEDPLIAGLLAPTTITGLTGTQVYTGR